MCDKINIIVFTCAFCIIVFISCNQGKTRHFDAPLPSQTEFETDSFRYALKTEFGMCEVYIDYPRQDGSAIAHAVADYIKSSLFENSSTQVADDPEVMVKKYCEQSIDRQKKTLEQMGIRHVDEADAPEEGMEIRKVYQSDRVVTYEVYRYSYLTNGPHGEYADYGVSFRRTDGKRIGNPVTNIDSTFYALIREGLRQYFDIATDEELQDICTVDIAEPPLPTFPPYLMGDGLRFHYSIYDVCRFDDGDPAFTIPYSRIMPYLSGEAKELLSQ